MAIFQFRFVQEFLNKSRISAFFSNKSIHPLLAAGLAIIFPYWLVAYMAESPDFTVVSYLVWISITYALFLWFQFRNSLTVPLLLAVGLLARLPGWFTMPLFEDDWARFLWDGYMTASYGSPYLQPPSAYFGTTDLPADMQLVLNEVNYPDIPTIYGPFLQWVFLASYWLKSASLPVLKILFFTFEVLACRVMHRRYSPNQIGWFYLNPILIKEVAFNAHPDGVAVSLVLVGVSLASVEKFSMAAFAVASALAAKVLAALYLPVLFFRQRLYVFLLMVPVVALVYYLPFWLNHPPQTDGAGLAAFLRHWEFNSLALWLFSLFFDDAVARYLNLGLFLGVSGAYLLNSLWGGWNSGTGPTVRTDTLLAIFFLFSPVVNGWYLLWWLPVLVFRNNWYYAALPLVAQLSYFNGANYSSGDLGWFEIPSILRVVEWGLMMGLFLAGRLQKYPENKLNAAK